MMARTATSRRSNIEAGAYAATVLLLPSSEGGGYLASAVELAGCVATGKTEAEALKELRDAIRSWMRTAREFGDPEPRRRRARPGSPTSHSPSIKIRWLSVPAVLAFSGTDDHVAKSGVRG
jgi:antitoxin HicB